MLEKLFGTNGIRGVFGDELNLELIHDVSLCLASYFGGGPVLVGYDGRISSPIVARAVCSALNFAGADCKLAGLVPTPCLEYSVRATSARGGVMVTASHNPPQYNGLKPVAADGVEISREDELKIESAYHAQKPTPVPPEWGRTGMTDIVRPYLEAVASHVDDHAIGARGLKVVLDVGNGAQSVTAPELCAMLDCEAVVINGSIDGTFPGRGPEPTPENLDALSMAVKEHGADLGVAFDGDGDRSMFCDERGRILTGERSALLLARHLLYQRPNSAVVTCVNSGGAIDEIAAESDSRVVRTRVGSVEVSRRMIPENALLGFEENGGFMYGPHNQVRDGAMTLALVLDLLAGTEQTISQLAGALPVSFTGKDKISCPAADAQRVLSALALRHPKADTTDGIRVTHDAKNWVMVRPSGTEPLIRVYAESDTEAGLNELISGQLREIRSILDGPDSNAC